MAGPTRGSQKVGPRDSGTGPAETAPDNPQKTPLPQNLLRSRATRPPGGPRRLRSREEPSPSPPRGKTRSRAVPRMDPRDRRTHNDAPDPEPLNRNQPAWPEQTKQPPKTPVLNQGARRRRGAGRDRGVRSTGNDEKRGCTSRDANRLNLSPSPAPPEPNGMARGSVNREIPPG